MNKKIENFTDLVTWKEAHNLVLKIYKITKIFPSEERYGLTDQIRRAAVSITSNIAEGFSRKSISEKKQFYYISLGSLTELQNQLIIAKDIDYMKVNDFNIVYEQTIIVSKLINSLIKYLNKLNT